MTDADPGEEWEPSYDLLIWITQLEEEEAWLSYLEAGCPLGPSGRSFRCWRYFKCHTTLN